MERPTTKQATNINPDGWDQSLWERSLYLFQELPPDDQERFLQRVQAMVLKKNIIKGGESGAPAEPRLRRVK